MASRENFKSRLGFLLVSAGCAIGVGNVWKFPYLAGSNGGGVFVLFYLLFLVTMGIPVMTMELAIGRASRRGAIESYKVLEKPGQKWHIHGWFCVLGCYMLMMYYTGVSGWIMNYFFKFLTGGFTGITTTDEVNNVFGTMMSRPGEMIIWALAVILLGFLVCSIGLQKGIEKVTKVMMIGLLGLIVVLAVRSAMLEGGLEGLKFYLIPDFAAAAAIGYKNIAAAAMNQAFFTLSIGIGSIEIFGSYMGKEQSILGESIRICVLDTFVALMAGLIIFPACFAYGIEPNSGPPLIFMTLPNIFVNMVGGRIWGTLFFLFLVFASFSTVVAVFESVMAACMEMFGWSRRKTAIINFIILAVTCIPAMLGYNVWSHVTPIGAKDILDSEDFIVSNLLLPLGSMTYLLFTSTKWGWGFDNYLAEVNTGNGLKLPKGIKYYYHFVLPVLVLVILVSGLI